MNLYDLVEYMALGMIDRVEITKGESGHKDFICLRMVANLPGGGKDVITYCIHETVPRLGERDLRERLMKEALEGQLEALDARWKRKDEDKDPAQE